MNQYNGRKRYCWSKILLPPKSCTLKEICRFSIVLRKLLSRRHGFLRDRTYSIQIQKAIIRNRFLKLFANYSLLSDIFLIVPALSYLIVLFKEVKDLCTD